MGKCSRCGKTMMALCAECMGQVKTGILLNVDHLSMILDNTDLEDDARARLELICENLEGFAEAFWPDDPKTDDRIVYRDGVPERSVLPVQPDCKEEAERE